MTDNNNSGEKTLTVGGGKTLSLKRPIEQGVVKQSFSHGRTNAVVVETVKRRPGGMETRQVRPPVVETKAQPVAPPPRPPAPVAPPRPAEAQSGLTNAENDRRAQALLEQRRRDEENRRRQEAEQREREERAAADSRRQAAEAAAEAAAARPKVESAPAPAPVAAPTPPASPVVAAPAAPPVVAPAPAPPEAPPPVVSSPAPTAVAPSVPPAPSMRQPVQPAPTARPMAPSQRPAGGGFDRGPRSESPQPREFAQRDYGQRPQRLDGNSFARPAGDATAPRREGAPPRDGAGGYRGDGAPREGGFRPRPEGGPPPREGAGGYRGDGASREGGFRPRPEGGPPREGGYRGDGAPREGGFRPRPEGGPPREGGFRPRPEGGPPREGGYRGGDGAPRRDSDRPSGTVRLGFAPRPGQGAPSGGLSARSAPGAGGLGGPRGPRGAPPIAGAPSPEFVEMRPQRQPGSMAPKRPPNFDDDEGARKTSVKAPAPGRTEKPKAGMEKVRGRLTIATVTSDQDERTRSVAAFKRRVQRMKGQNANEPREKILRDVIIPEAITIQELANRMSERGVDVIRNLMKLGQMHKITDTIDADTAQLVAEEMGHTVKRVADSDVEEGLFSVVDEGENLIYRPPVVTIMGHVDHGKTSLLDAIRKTNVVKGEAGGITQHIGAYQVTSPLGGKITFIDTPGHAAFTAMRARGARVTDIVVLVVAADDGVMPQTVEAINHAKAAKVPLIVAINKIDKPEAKPERVRNELLQHDVQVESMGGETIEIEVSAKAGTNLDKLLEMIQLQAEVLELRANPDRAAEGTVIEAKLDRGRGPVATVLIERGTLRAGDIVVAGSEWGRVRALINDQGDHVQLAEPSVPVEVLGFNGAPEAGDRLAVVENEARAREITDYRDRLKREKQAARGGVQGRSLVELMKAAKDGAGRKEFPLIIKGDVQGSVEAIAASVEKLGNDEVRGRVLHTGVGGVTESDITLAQATGSVVVAFNVRAHKEARESAERNGVEIRYYSIIYDLVDDVKKAMSGLLAPTLRETMMGNAEIRQVFNITKVGNVAGCLVTDGKVERGMGVRLIRDNVVIHEGTLKTLKRFKDEVKEVQVGQECGMAFTNYEDMRAGDVIECFRVEEIKRSL
ncbi:translation initiation factor IF-2 [Rhabdaerophilaceae bacterium]